MFDDKEKAAENKYARDKETEFKVQARAHKLLGLWAAEKLSLSGAKAEEYANILVTGSYGAKGSEGMFEHLKRDLAAGKVVLSDHDLRLEMLRLEQQAREQVVGK